MAHPSPSPSGSSSRRRLSEVLGEQQEPFSLDLYLLERGCSPAFLDATSCGGGACSTCWPKTRGTGRTLRRPARNKKGSRRSGVLRMLLSKILSGTAATKQSRQQRAAIGWRHVVAEKQRTPDSFELALRPAPPRAVEAHMEDDGEQEQDDDEDESSKKQLSPVSVLEQRLFEHSPPPPHEPKALAIFSELLEAAYTPNTLLDLDDVLAIAKDQSSSTQSKDGRRRRSSSTDSSTPPTPPRARRRKKKKHARRKEDVALEKDLGRLTSLVASEMAGASVRAEDLRPSVEDVGVLIAAAVLETLTEEAAAELMGMDRGCAVGVAGWCGRC
ncbi:unnamed protein product [Miscanthus lutarioriparius]|uniref:Uncharacterized protein n=1 Tax=Miscanthus lutarioriparius TaxID=422564 RepID=A0A811RCS2_9POAL|nr:unnamed protein product [Miscanthus lutarioriparius]